MADKREFLVVIDGRETVSPASGKASDSLGKLGDQAKKTEKDFTGLDRKMREHAETIAKLREEIAKTGDTKLFGELSRQTRGFDQLSKLRKQLADEGEPAASGFFARFVGRLGPLVANMPISGPLGISLAAGATAAAPAIGAIVAAAVLGGAGVGGVVGGLAIAKNDPGVKTAAAGVAKSIGDQLKDAAVPFNAAAIAGLNEFRDEARAADGDLRKLFQATSRYVEPLAGGAGRGARAVIEGLADAAEGAEPVVDALADGAESLGETLGDLFSDLSDDGPEAAQALSDAFTVLNVTLSGTGKIIEGLTNSYGWLRKNQGLVGDLLLGPYAGAVTEADQVTDEFTQAQEDLTEQVKASDAAFQAQIKSVGDAAAAYADGRRAGWDFKDGLAGLTEQIKENGTSLDENTEKGRSNLRYLDDQISKADRAAKAAEAMARANGASAEGAAAAGAMLRRTWINDLVAAATKAGIAKKDIDRMVAAARRADNTQIDLYFNQRYRTFGRPIDPTTQYVPGLSKGGPVGGGGPPGKDTQLRMLASDEYVLTGEEVRAAGGAGAVKSALRGGGVPAVAAAAVGGVPAQNGSMLITIDLMGILRKVVRVQYGGNVQLALGG